MYAVCIQNATMRVVYLADCDTATAVAASAHIHETS